MTLYEVNEAAEVIFDLVDPNANLIFGAVVDANALQPGEVSITLIATGFGTNPIGKDGDLAAFLSTAKPLPHGQVLGGGGAPKPGPAFGGDEGRVAPGGGGGGFEIPSFLKRRATKR